MNKTTTHKPTRSSFALLHQLCDLIPAHLVPRLARDTGVAKRARTFTPWSHVVSLLYAQLTHAIGLNDVCDALRLHSGPLSAVRGATPPSKNALSTANRERSAQMAQDLFYAVLGHLEKLHPGFGRDRRPRFAFRFKRVIHLVDATTIQLVARCLDGAKHRRRQVPPPARPANLPAALRHRGHRRRTRKPARPRSVRRRAGRGDCHL
ncbi:MAG: DUF4372 domain-containing protein [Verrucomicrobiales bacterium]|nr:DUF4372 domain-containing protein [Verrucomicrobiales bacterium]